jgi:hypothetical protein
MNIDFDKLRQDLLDYFGTAMTMGFGAAIIDISKVENASNEELINIAKQNGFDLNKYVVQSFKI